MYTTRSVCSFSDHTLTPGLLRWHVCISDNNPIHKTDEALAAPEQAQAMYTARSVCSFSDHTLTPGLLR
jgi:hypothetical protein